MSLEPHFLAHCSGTSCVGGPFRGAVYRVSASQHTLRVHTGSVQVREQCRIDESGAQVGLVHITVEHCRWVLPLCLPPSNIPCVYTASVYNWMSLEPHFLAHCSGTSCVGGPFRGAVYRVSASQHTLRVHTGSVQVREQCRIDESGAQVGLVHIDLTRWYTGRHTVAHGGTRGVALVSHGASCGCHTGAH